MESIPTPKKPGAARAGVLAAFLLLALLLALPGIWYARYRNQLATTSVAFPQPGASPFRPSGAITLPPPTPGRLRTVQIQHTGGKVITMVHDGPLTISARTTDPCPPSNALDSLGQSLCDRYNAWNSARGDPRQPPNMFMGTGPMIVQIHYSPTTSLVRPPTVSAREAPLPSAHAPGTPAPGSSPRPAAHTPARP